MSRLTEPIFDIDDVLEVSYNRVKEDYIKVSPIGGSNNLNKAGEVRFELNNQQHYINFSESFLMVDFSITKGDGTALGNDDITLENNPFPRMFNSFRLEVGGREVEIISQAVGEVSTIANFIMASDTFKRTYGQIAGWMPDTSKGDTDVADIDANYGYFWRKKIYNDKKTYTLMFPLKYIFGFTEYTKILYLIKIGLILSRKDDGVINADIFYGAATMTGKITLNNLEWWVPYIEPSLEIEELITKRLNTKKPIDCVFMKRSCGKETILEGTKHSWKLGNFNNSVRFVFVAFKNTTAPVATANNALFTQTDGTPGNIITSLRLQLNNMYYPIDRCQFNFEKYKIAEPYIAYVNACKTFE